VRICRRSALLPAAPSRRLRLVDINIPSHRSAYSARHQATTRARATTRTRAKFRRPANGAPECGLKQSPAARGFFRLTLIDQGPLSDGPRSMMRAWHHEPLVVSIGIHLRRLHACSALRGCRESFKYAAGTCERSFPSEVERSPARMSRGRGLLIDLPMIWMQQKRSRSPVRTHMPFLPP
jgi:hypothetical protein